MSKASVALLAFCCAAAGVMLGLLVAAMTQPTLGAVARERDGLASQLADLQKKLAETAAEPKRIERPAAPDSTSAKPDWGPLENLRKRFEPGSPAYRFLTTLHQAEVFQPGNYWEIRSPTGFATDININVTPLGEGKVFMIAFLNWLESLPTLEVTFQPERIMRPEDMSRRFRERMVLLGSAFGLTREEADRLDRLCAKIPLVNPDVARPCMLRFVQGLPANRLELFNKRLALYENPVATKAMKIDLEGIGPAVGFPLSEKLVADLAFVASRRYRTTSSDPDDQPDRWWSLSIHDANLADYTSATSAEKLGDLLLLEWPRLRLPEVDLFLSR